MGSLCISTARWLHTVIIIAACLEGGSKLCYRCTCSGHVRGGSEWPRPRGWTLSLTLCVSFLCMSCVLWETVIFGDPRYLRGNTRYTDSSSRRMFIPTCIREAYLEPIGITIIQFSREALPQYSYTRFVQNLGVRCTEGLALQCSSFISLVRMHNVWMTAYCTAIYTISESIWKSSELCRTVNIFGVHSDRPNLLKYISV